MKTLILSIVVCFMLGNIALAQSWESFTKTTPEVPIVNLTNSNNQSVSFTVEVCGMYKQDVMEGSETFQRIEIPGAGRSLETGAPELPYIRQLIAIPECDDVILNVNITEQTNFDNYNIYPVPDYEEATDQNGGVYVQEVFNKDETAYTQNVYLNGVNAEIVSVGYLRNQKYAEVFLYPVQFNPVNQHIEVYTHYEIILNFVNPTTNVNVNTGIFNNVATNTMLNYVTSGIKASINDNMQGNGNVQWVELTAPEQADNIVADYLIICSDPFFEPNNPNSEVLRIANHRAAYNGFDVAIVNAHTIYEVLDFEFSDPAYQFEQKIRTCVRRIYEGTNAQHTYDGKLGYVLLIGKTKKPDNLGMPTSYDPNPGASFYGDPYPSDYYYSCLTSDDGIYDDIGDLYIGRFCVDNNLQNGLTELHNMVSKTIYYEAEATFGGWKDEIGVLLGDNMLGDYLTSYFNFFDNLVPSYYTVDKIDGSQPNSIGNVLEVMNDGVMMFTYNGHGIQYGLSISNNEYLSKTYLKDNLVNNNKAPIFNAVSCQTGWFDMDNECFAEALTTYSDIYGFTAYVGAGRSAIGSSGNSVFDPPIRFQELLPYTVFNNLSQITGEYILESKILCITASDFFAFNLFGDPALNVMAQGYEITHDITLEENTIISTEVTVKSGSTLTLKFDRELFFEQEGKLIIEDGATLNLQDFTKIHGNSISQKIVLKGNISLGINVEFTAPENYRWGGLEIDYLSQDININYARFNRCNVTANFNLHQVNFNGCNFTNEAKIDFSGQKIKISNSTFDINSWVYMVFGDRSSYAEIINCTFTNHSSTPLVVKDYSGCIVENCTFTNNGGAGISLSRTRTELTGNNFTNNGFTHQKPGIEIYQSSANINLDNIISGNYYGITCLNNSNISIVGNSEATYVSETQQITNNSKNQLYATHNSFPYEFEWNAVIDEDNSFPLLHNEFAFGTSDILNVSNNYWGNNFNPTEDLYPYEYYSYEPIWQLQTLISDDDVKILYYEAQDKIIQEDYVGAENNFHQLINNYSNTGYALASLHSLFYMEALANNNYTALKNYYNTDASIQSNPNLSKLAYSLANNCDIELENYAEAIAWFENVILYPETIEDSIFAIIDLGYTYFLMDSNNRSVVRGALKEYIPKSRESYSASRDTLLSLLFKDAKIDKDAETVAIVKTHGKLSQNFPNPVLSNTSISYYLEYAAEVTLNIYDNSGRNIKTIRDNNNLAGVNAISFDTGGLPPGVYIYSLTVNDKVTDSKRLIIHR